MSPNNFYTNIYVQSNEFLCPLCSHAWLRDLNWAFEPGMKLSWIPQGQVEPIQQEVDYLLWLKQKVLLWQFKWKRREISFSKLEPTFHAKQTAIIENFFVFLWLTHTNTHTCEKALRNIKKLWLLYPQFHRWIWQF